MAAQKIPRPAARATNIRIAPFQAKEDSRWFQRHQNQVDQPETGMAQIYPQLKGIANVEAARD